MDLNLKSTSESFSEVIFLRKFARILKFLPFKNQSFNFIIMLPKINPTQTQAWKNLQDHFAQSDFDLRSLFQNNSERFNQFSVKRENFIFDYSKNLIDQKTFDLLQSLAKECDVKTAITAMFSGQKINETEGGRFYIQLLEILLTRKF